MCTATWSRTGDGLDLLFNRDERTTRRPARGPSVRELDGVRCIMPADGDFGGTWISVNQRGVALCLLNRYQDAAEAASGEVSRGLLMLGLAPSRSLDEVVARLERERLARFAPFTVAALEPSRAALLAEWTGKRLTLSYDADDRVPLVSSGVDQDGVARERARLLAEMRRGTRDGVDLLEQFHRSHEPERGALSPCMHRDDASTVSFSRVQVRTDYVEFVYRAAPPCVEGDDQMVRLARRGARSG